MRILLLFYLIILLSSCATIEMGKEVTKATKNIKITVNNIVKNSENNNEEKVIEEINIDKRKMDNEIANLEKEKREKKEIIKEQKKKTKINFIGKTTNGIKLIVGEPKLIRIDGNSKTIRFDNNFCQLFLFSNAKKNNAKVEYFEIRNKEGKLIINREKIEKCYKKFKLI